jgi:hypothetical protein
MGGAAVETGVVMVKLLSPKPGKNILGHGDCAHKMRGRHREIQINVDKL